MGETTQDLFAHLTRAYKAVPDKFFKNYIVNKIDTHNDGTARLTSDELMDIAKAKYDEMTQDNTWMANEEAEAKLVALHAQLEQVELKNKRYEAQRRKNKSDDKKPKKKQTKSTDNDKWKWKEQTPRPGQTTRTVNGKTYHWCVYHKKWCLDNSDGCRLKPVDNTDSNPTVNQPALQAVLDDGTFSNL